MACEGDERRDKETERRVIGPRRSEQKVEGKRREQQKEERREQR